MPNITFCIYLAFRKLAILVYPNKCSVNNQEVCSDEVLLLSLKIRHTVQSKNSRRQNTNKLRKSGKKTRNLFSGCNSYHPRGFSFQHFICSWRARDVWRPNSPDRISSAFEPLTASSFHHLYIISCALRMTDHTTFISRVLSMNFKVSRFSQSCIFILYHFLFPPFPSGRPSRPRLILFYLHLSCRPVCV